MDEQISQFISITGASSDRARFFVEAANGDVEEAVSSFYENDGNDQPTSDATMAASSSAGAAETVPDNYTGPRTLSGAPAQLPSDWGSGAPATGSSAQRAGGGFSAGGGRGGIATLGDLRGSDAPSSRSRGGAGGPRIGRLNHDDDDDEDEDEGRGPANLFAGGGRSALNVQNPDRGGGNGDRPDIVRDILRQAAEAGAGPEGALPVGSGRAAPSSSSTAFSGRGRTIGSEADDAASTEAGGGGPPGSSLPGGFGGAGGAFGAGQDDDEEEEDDEEPAVRHLTFWQDGFSVEDGPLMRYDDPAHEATLALIRQGRAPLSLLNVRFGQPVELRVADRKSEKYVPPPKAPMKPFEGAGNRLGSPSPAIGGAGASASSSAAAAAVPSASASSSTTPAGGMQFQVDASQPTTQIQIRLGDGSRLVGKFNLSHTVSDVRRYIDAAHPSNGRSYSLHTSFPPKPLSDDAATIEAAGLKGAVVIQKWD